MGFCCVFNIPTDTMKVLHMLQSPRFSGAENVVCQIIGFLKNKIEFTYCSRDGQIRNALADRDIRFVPVASITYKEFIRVISKEKPDIIHAHDISASVLAAFTSGLTPVISHVHVNNDDMAKVNKKTILYLISSIKYKHIFWVSSSCYNSFVFKNFVKKKSTVLINVMDKNGIIEKANSDSAAYFYDIVYIGRLSYQKNPLRMLKIFEDVVEQMPEVKIAVIGTGELEHDCRAVLESSSLQNNVDFLGFKENPLKILQDAKVMVMTSRFEGTPMTALEAMALGVPIVSTPTDGMNDLIENGVNGYLSDNDEELASRLLAVIRDETLHSELSKNTADKFDSMMDCDAYQREIENVYKDAIH